MDFVLLVLQTAWFLAVNHFIGWLLLPRGMVLTRSRLAKWAVWNGLGSAFLILIGMFLVQINIPGKWVILAPVALGGYKYLEGFLLKTLPPRLLRRLSKFIFVPDFQWRTVSSPQFLRDLAYYSLAVSVPVLFFYYPFLERWTSGFYSMSGGDHSIYLRVSEFFLNNGIDAQIPNRELLLPPYPNWNILTYIKSIQAATGGLFAGSMTSMPSMALWPGYIETSYMASICVSFVSVVTAMGALVGYLFGKNEKYMMAGMLAIASSNLFLWSAARHSAPAFFVLGISGALILLLLDGLARGRFVIIPVSILAATAFSVYAPSFLVFLLIPGFAFFYFSVQFWRGKRSLLLYWGGLLLTTALAYGLITALLWNQTENLFRTILVGTSFEGADFGLKAKDALYTLSGSLDFDLLFPTSLAAMKELAARWGLIASVIIYSLSAISLICGRVLYKVSLLPFILIVSYLAIKYLGTPTTQYAGIRLVGLAAEIILATAGVGLYFLWTQCSRIQTKWLGRVASLLLLVLPLTLFPIKKSFWDRVLLKVHHEHSDFVDADALRMAHDLEGMVKNSPLKPTVYWFGSGAVAFASSEILFRKIPYFEAYNYDYESYIPSHEWWRDVHLDILEKGRIANAIFVIPRTYRGRVIKDNCGLQSEPTSRYGNTEVFDTSQTSGITFIGDAWNPPIPYSQTEPWGRFLLGRKAGIAIWSQKKITLKLGFDVYADKKNSGQGIRLIFKEKVLDVPIKDESEFSMTVDIDPGMNIIVVHPTGPYKLETWGHIQRNRWDQLTVTDLIVDCPQP